MHQLTTWLNKLVKLWICSGICLLPFLGEAQQKLSLKQAFEQAEISYPGAGQKALLQQTQQLNIQNLATAYLPQVNLNAQATYQSEVTKLNVPIPGFTVPQVSRDQYKATADVSQLIYDGGLVKEQQVLQQLSTAVEESKVDVELYQLKNRVFQLYFGILYQQELLDQTNLLLKDVAIGIDKVQPQVDNGVLLRSNLLLLQAQQLQTRQRSIEITNNKKGLLQALAALLHMGLDENIVLQKEGRATITDTVIARPELQLYVNQQALLSAQKKLVDAKNLPKLSAFVQGGYGRPGLNFLSDNFRPFYVTGLRANWALGNLYNAKRDKKLLDINQRTVALQKETFVLNTQTQLVQQQAEIDKYTALLESDGEIISLKQQVSDAAKAQLQNAVITTNDYLIQINAQDQARQAMIIHELQLLQAKVNFAITAGTF